MKVSKKLLLIIGMAIFGAQYGSLKAQQLSDGVLKAADDLITEMNNSNGRNYAKTFITTFREQIQNVIATLTEENPDRIMGPDANRIKLQEKALEVINTTISVLNSTTELNQLFSVKQTSPQLLKMVKALFTEKYAQELLQNITDTQRKESEQALTEVFGEEGPSDFAKTFFDKVLQVKGSSVKMGLSDSQQTAVKEVTRNWTTTRKGNSSADTIFAKTSLSLSLFDVYANGFSENFDASSLFNSRLIIDSMGTMIPEELYPKITTIILEAHFEKNIFGTELEAFEHLASINRQVGSEKMLTILQELFSQITFEKSSEIKSMVESLHTTLEGFNAEKTVTEKTTFLERFSTKIESFKRFCGEFFNAKQKALATERKSLQTTFNKTKAEIFINERIEEGDHASVTELFKGLSQANIKQVSETLLKLTSSERAKVLKNAGEKTVTTVLDELKRLETVKASNSVNSFITDKLKEGRQAQANAQVEPSKNDPVNPENNEINTSENEPKIEVSKVETRNATDAQKNEASLQAQEKQKRQTEEQRKQTEERKSQEAKDKAATEDRERVLTPEHGK